MTRIETFAAKAKQLIDWAERNELRGAHAEGVELLKLLLELQRAALDLPHGFPAENYRETAALGEWRRVLDRCSVLPFDIYWMVFDPLNDEERDPVCGSLADDVADTYRDLIAGMSYFEEGDYQAAAWVWRFHFRAHFGHHVSAAIYALQAWWSDQYLGDEPPSSDTSSG